MSDAEPILNGAKGYRKCRRHRWVDGPSMGLSVTTCVFCGTPQDPAASRRGRANGKRGRRAELTIAREIPGARKMGPLGLPWDVEVGDYARLQVKKLVARPSANAIRKLIEAIPDTGDRLRGFVWVEAAGQGKHGQRVVWFDAGEFAQWHGARVPVAHAFAGVYALLSMSLADWCETFVSPTLDLHGGAK